MACASDNRVRRFDPFTGTFFADYSGNPSGTLDPFCMSWDGQHMWVMGYGIGQLVKF